MRKSCDQEVCLQDGRFLKLNKEKKSMSKKMLYSLMAVLVATIMILSACGPKPVATGSAQVGVVLPTKDEPRWLQDQAIFQKAGYEPLFSQGSSATEKANVEALISQGVKVIIITPQDATAAAAAAEEAKAAGVKIISY